MYIYPSSRSSSFSWLLGLFWYLVYFWYFSWYIVPHGFGKDDFVLNCIVLYCINVNWSGIENTISNEFSALIPQSFAQNYVTDVWVGLLVITHQTRDWNTPPHFVFRPQ